LRNEGKIKEIAKRESKRTKRKNTGLRLKEMVGRHHAIWHHGVMPSVSLRKFLASISDDDIHHRDNACGVLIIIVPLYIFSPPVDQSVKKSCLRKTNRLLPTPTRKRHRLSLL
jgi:hypothetical protein